MIVFQKYYKIFKVLAFYSTLCNRRRRHKNQHWQRGRKKTKTLNNIITSTPPGATFWNRSSARKRTAQPTQYLVHNYTHMRCLLVIKNQHSLGKWRPHVRSRSSEPNLNYRKNPSDKIFLEMSSEDTDTAIFFFFFFCGVRCE